MKMDFDFYKFFCKKYHLDSKKIESLNLFVPFCERVGYKLEGFSLPSKES